MALLTAQNKDDLVSATDEANFMVIANAIRTANGYVLPDDWWQAVMGPNGIAKQLRVTWGNPTAFSAALVWNPIPQAPWPPPPP